MITKIKDKCRRIYVFQHDTGMYWHCPLSVHLEWALANGFTIYEEDGKIVEYCNENTICPPPKCVKDRSSSAEMTEGERTAANIRLGMEIFGTDSEGKEIKHHPIPKEEESKDKKIDKVIEALSWMFKSITYIQPYSKNQEVYNELKASIKNLLQ